nr:meiotic recombination protein dmc1 [Quercus suber]
MTKNLIKIKGMSETKVEKIKEAVSKCMVLPSLVSRCQEIFAADVHHSLTPVGSRLLPSFCSFVDAAFVFRLAASSWTRCSTAASSRRASASLSVDTEGTYRPQRIIDIANRFNVDAETASENIIYIRADNSENQHTALLKLAEHFTAGDFRLLIIDSICALFRVDYQGRGELSERQQKLGQHLSVLTRMAEEFNLAVFITNQVQSDPGASAIFASADGRKPIGGHVVAHASATRILLRKGRGLERVAKIVDSPGSLSSHHHSMLKTCC